MAKATLMQRYTDYNDRLKARGIKLIAFACPECGESIETQSAPKGEVWDALSDCPHCERMFMKITEGGIALGVESPILMGDPAQLRGALKELTPDDVLASSKIKIVKSRGL